MRPSGSLLLADALEQVPDAAAVSTSASRPGVAVRAWLYTAAYRPLQRLEMHVAISLEEGTHVYREPVPTGFTPLTMRLSGAPSLEYEQPVLPAGVPLRVDGLHEDFVVLSGQIRTSVPFLLAEDEGDVALTLVVACQQCTESVCDPPLELRLVLELEGRSVLRP